MKQIPLLQGKALLIEMPNLKLITTIHKGLLVAGVNQKDVSSKCRRIDRGDVKGFLHLPPGNWHIIGMLSEVTDAELADVTGFYYNKYNERYVEMPTSAMRATPIGDIEDAILAEGYYLDENPHGEEPKPENTPNYAYSVDVRIWESAQSRVLDRSRCLLLGREI